MTFRLLLLLVVLLAGTWMPRVAQAAISCAIVTDPDLSYGTINLPVSTGITSTTYTRVRCTGTQGGDRGDPIKVCVGLNTPASPRAMGNGAGASITHRLYKDAAYAQELNYATINTEAILTLPGSGALPVTVTGDLMIYGRLQGSTANPPAGNYSEAITGDMGWSTNTATPCANVNAAGATSFAASTLVRANCTLATSNLSFGTVNVLTANVDATTTIGLNCTNGSAWTMRLNGGTVANNVVARRMGPGGAGPGVINYQLRHTSPAGPLWGDGTGGTTVLTGTGNGTSQTVTVYGRVPGGQPAPPVGTYTDTVTATVEF